jgi:hypothetical protein
MIPGQLFTIRQSLNKACRLVKPRRAALEAFNDSLLTWLYPADGIASAEETKRYLLEILQDTCFAPGYEEPQDNSSPVCFAHIPGLRADFADPCSPDLPAPAGLATNSLPGTSPTNRLTRNTDLREALQATQFSVRLILCGKRGPSPTAATREEQIKELVYLLYELSPEEIVHLEGSEDL